MACGFMQGSFNPNKTVSPENNLKESVLTSAAFPEPYPLNLNEYFCLNVRKTDNFALQQLDAVTLT